MMLCRRTFLRCILAFFAATGSLYAQTPASVPRVAVVLNGWPETHGPYWDAFLQGMHNLGYIPNRNVHFDLRWAEGRLDRIPAILSELLRNKPDVILVAGSQAVRAAKAATPSVPIVVAAISAPVAQGLIASLERPGGNITGISIPSDALISRILERLHELVPAASRIAVLADPSNPAHAIDWQIAQTRASKLGLQLLRFDASRPSELERTLDAIAVQRPQALVVGADALFNSFRQRIVRFAAANRIPSGFPFSDAVAEGGLMSYSINIGARYFRAANYVHRILQGENPGELPFEQSHDLQFAINLRTAKALGITVPQSVAANADEVVE